MCPRRPSWPCSSSTNRAPGAWPRAASPVLAPGSPPGEKVSLSGFADPGGRPPGGYKSSEPAALRPQALKDSKQHRCKKLTKKSWRIQRRGRCDKSNIETNTATKHNSTCKYLTSYCRQTTTEKSTKTSSIECAACNCPRRTDDNFNGSSTGNAGAKAGYSLGSSPSLGCNGSSFGSCPATSYGSAAWVGDTSCSGISLSIEGGTFLRKAQGLSNFCFGIGPVSHIQILGNSYRRENADDRYHDHQFNQGKCFTGEFLGVADLLKQQQASFGVHDIIDGAAIL